MYKRKLRGLILQTIDCHAKGTIPVIILPKKNSGKSLNERVCKAEEGKLQDRDYLLWPK